MERLQITTEFIQLNQLLKLVGWADNGAVANEMIENELVLVNGETETRKRNKIYPGMVVSFDGEQVEVVK